MTERDMHLNDEMLDRLRSGWFDDAGEARRARGHLDACARCREAFARWDAVVHDFAGGIDAPAALGRELARRRGAALAGSRGSTRAGSRWSYALAGAAAALAVAVGVELGTQLVAPVEPGNMATARAPEFFTDIDFYVWLANRGEDPGQGS